jgi:exopolysaccharide production protein ExoZ
MAAIEVGAGKGWRPPGSRSVLALEPVRHGAIVAREADFRTIQALRAIAALLVVLYHGFEMWALRVDPAAAVWPNGAAGVDIFFVISGFVMVMASRRIAALSGGWRVFIAQRLARIVPLYWLVTSAKLVLVFAFAGLALRSNLGLDYVVRSYLFLPLADSGGHFRPLLPVGWTLTFELLFYLLFALALALRVDVLRVLLPGLGLVAIAALFRGASWPAWTMLFDTIVIEFIFGVVLARLLLRGWILPPVLATCCVVVGFALILTVTQGAQNLRTLTWGLPALAIVAGAVSLEGRLADAIPRWLLVLGDASYSIYLTHGFVVPAVGLAFVTLHWATASAEALAVLACLAASSIVGVAVYRAIERPIMRGLKRRPAALS